MDVDTSWLSFENTTARLGVLYAASLGSFLVTLFLLTCTTSIELKGLRRSAACCCLLRLSVQPSPCGHSDAFVAAGASSRCDLRSR